VSGILAIFPRGQEFLYESCKRVSSKRVTRINLAAMEKAGMRLQRERERRKVRRSMGGDW
jgi:hypothetical protein